jgi:hypothetical protein
MELGVVGHALIPVCQRLRQEDHVLLASKTLPQKTKQQNKHKPKGRDGIDIIRFPSLSPPPWFQQRFAKLEISIRSRVTKHKTQISRIHLIITQPTKNQETEIHSQLD